MRVGLLICDHAPEELAGLAGDYPDMFAELLAAHPDLELVPYDLTQGHFPESGEECDGWIITGSVHSVYDDVPWIRQLERLVRDLVAERRKLVGICFGHQMIGQALGGKVERAPQGWAIGVREVEVHEHAPWMDPPADRFRLVHSHADQIVEPPEGIRILASSEHCPISVLAYGDHVLGIQGHPEFIPAFARAQMERRRGKVIDHDVVDAALGTLSSQPDRPLVASWIRSFLDTPTDA
ncbi:MAG: type 1 glutamine amidotransferase [Acidimicrobiia bacterium]